MDNASLAFTYLMIEFDIISNIGKAYEFEVNRALLEKAVEAIISTRFDLVNINERRRIKQRHGTEFARDSIVSDGEIAVVIMDKEYSGVMNIIASGLLSSYSAAIVMSSIDGEKYVGSARSKYNLLPYIKKRFKAGGHNKAFGVTVMKEEYEDFLDYISKFVPKDEEIDDSIDGLIEDGINF